MHSTSARSESVDTALEIANEALAAWQGRAASGAARSSAKIEQLLHFLVRAFPGDITLSEAQKVALEQGDKLSVHYLKNLRARLEIKRLELTASPTVA